MFVALPIRTVVAALLALAGHIQALYAEPGVGDLRVRYNKLSQEFAAANPTWQPQPPASGSLIFIAPDEYSPVALSVASPDDARIKYADALFSLATEAANVGQLSLAFQWATETLRQNPDHAEARRVLGYEQRDGQWLTAYGAKMYDGGKLWDAKRGWVAKDDAKAPAASDKSDAARHADIRNGWKVRTDHFQVTTNTSLEGGAVFAAQLEQLYQVWRQMFAGFYYTEKEVRDLFAGERIARWQSHPFRVFYYRDRDEYLNALRRRQPRIAETLGIYFDNTREAHFFAGGHKDITSTLYHEAVHQLFQESKPTAKQVGTFANFWVVEGVATYFETLTEHDDPQTGLYFTIGESAVGRLPVARERLRQGFFIPLAELARLGRDDVQRHPEIAKLYGQSTGVVAFLLGGENGRYQEPLVTYLQAVYAGRDNAQSLATGTGASFEELDKQFRRYMESLP